MLTTERGNAKLRGLALVETSPIPEILRPLATAYFCLLGTVVGMKSSVALHWLLVALWSVLGPASALAAITSSGDIEPGDPATWTSSTQSYVGKTSDGTITVDGGSDLKSGAGYLGYSPSSMGEATVSGTGSQWISPSISLPGIRG
ncbi:hypothetical protein [Botrimarina colliarenosi]|uniref:hypothetical protein n=1 Tax=Botrimarina colliarenosi TaxID=2528001 RepID=UPI0011B77FBE